MDSSIMTEKEDETVATSQPPTRIITVKNEYTVRDQDEMLALAQKKFDYLRRKNRERAKSSRYQRLSRGGRMVKSNHEQTKVSQLLSSLLYLALMMHKVDDMKKILEHRDSNLFSEWVILLGSLHSPVFHMRERRIQNERVKKIFNRKHMYKVRYEETKADLIKSQDTLQDLSQSLSKLTEDNKIAHVLLNERRDIEKDLASTRSESENRELQIVKHEDSIKELKSECYELHTIVESLKAENGKLIQSIKTHEQSDESNENEISSLKKDVKEKCEQIHQCECRIVSLEKDIEAYRIQLSQEQESHKTTKEVHESQLEESKSKQIDMKSRLTITETNTKQIELKLYQEISILQQKVADAKSHAATQTAELAMKQLQLDQTRKDLDSETAALKEALNTIKSETGKNQSLQQKQISAMKDIAALEASVQKGQSDNVHLTQSIATLESNIKDKSLETESKVNGLKDKLKGNELNLVKAEKDVAVLNNTIFTLERSLSEALQLKTSAEEQKQKLLDGEANSVNLSIEKLTGENLRITQMMSSMKDSLMQDVHTALEQQKAVEEESDSLRKELVETEKEVAVLKCTKVSLEKSLSEALEMKTSAEEQKQKLIEGETNTFKSSIEKLTEDNYRNNKMMTSMKDSLMQDIHNAIEEQKVSEEKEDKLQKELLKAEKEITSLKYAKKSLEISLSGALESKTSVEEQRKKLFDEKENNFNSSIQKLSSENLRLTEMMSSMKDSLVQDVCCALQKQKEVDQNSISQNTFKDAKHNFDKTSGKSLETDNDLKENQIMAMGEMIIKDDIKNDTNISIAEENIEESVVAKEAKTVVNMAVQIAIDKVSA